ncbi:25173_t:CDS:2, partial [Racocetra persica]
IENIKINKESRISEMNDNNAEKSHLSILTPSNIMVLLDWSFILISNTPAKTFVKI